MSSPQVSGELIEAAHHLLAGKYFQIASFVMLVYDHGLTISDEVERIWQQPFSIASLLFVLNRYGNLLEFIVIIDAFFDPIWSEEVCHRFVKFEGAGTVTLVGICQFMILRVYALYGRSIWVLAFLLTLLAGQTSIAAVGLSLGFPVPLPPPLKGCILTGTNSLFPALWVAPLITDTFIFVLTLWRTRKYLKESGSTRIIQLLLRDGILYYFVIFLTNLMNVIIYFRAREDLKAIGASFIQLITSVIISRLVLNLRGVPAQKLPYRQEVSTEPIYYRPGLRVPDFKEDRVIRVLGNLGGDLATFHTET